jgi:hypothetical protein
MGDSLCDRPLRFSWPDLVLVKMIKLILVRCAGVEGLDVYYGNKYELTSKVGEIDTFAKAEDSFDGCALDPVNSTKYREGWPRICAVEGDEWNLNAMG